MCSIFIRRADFARGQGRCPPAFGLTPEYLDQEKRAGLSLAQILPPEAAAPRRARPLSQSSALKFRLAPSLMPENQRAVTVFVLV